MTQTKAIYLLKTVWPQAPDAEIAKASIICATYGLNPLLKQISIISFKNKAGGRDWVTVLGIKATRNIALGTGHKFG
jgi:RecT family.